MVPERKAAKKLQRILALANGSSFEGEASTAAKMADDFIRKNRLGQHIPDKARFWMIATDTGHLIWRFQPFSDAEVRDVPGTRRWVGQACWGQHVTFALNTGQFSVWSVFQFEHDTLIQIPLQRDEGVIGSFFGEAPITIVSVTKNGRSCLSYISQNSRQNSTPFIRLAAGDRVVSAKAVPSNATHLCLLTDHGLALTTSLRSVTNGSRRAIRLNPGDYVRDVRVVSDINLPLRWGPATDRIEILPVNFLRPFTSEGMRIKPPAEDTKAWWFRTWNEEAARRTSPGFPQGLLRQFRSAGYKPVTQEEKEAFLAEYTEHRLNTAVATARHVVAAFRGESVQACSDALWWLYLLGTEPEPAERRLFAMFTHDPLLFCAVTALCDVSQSIPAEAIELLWAALTGEKLPSSTVTSVLQKTRGG
jgi:hypothetical protein